MAAPTSDNLLLQTCFHKPLKVIVLSYRQLFIVVDWQTRLWCGMYRIIRHKASPSQRGRLSQLLPYAILVFVFLRILYALIISLMHTADGSDNHVLYC